MTRRPKDDISPASNSRMFSIKLEMIDQSRLHLISDHKPSIWRGGKNALIKIRIQQILILVSASGERFYNLPNLGGRGVFPPPSPTCENEDTLPFPCYSLHNDELFR